LAIAIFFSELYYNSLRLSNVFTANYLLSIGRSAKITLAKFPFPITFLFA